MKSHAQALGIEPNEDNEKKTNNDNQKKANKNKEKISTKEITKLQKTIDEMTKQTESLTSSIHSSWDTLKESPKKTKLLKH